MSISLEFPGPLAGSVIGKGGNTLRSIQTASGATLQLSQALAERYLPCGRPNAAFASSFRTVRVSGSLQSIHTACERVVRVLRAEMARKSMPDNGTITAIVPSGAARMLRANDEKGARAASGATVALESHGSTGAGTWKSTNTCQA